MTRERLASLANYIYIFIYLYTYVSTCHMNLRQTDRRIDKTTMPDECNFDSVTYALKIEARDPFRGVDSILICWRKE